MKDHKDIWEYFLGKEKKEEKTGEDSSSAGEGSDHKTEDEEKDFFIKNFEKFLPFGSKEADLEASYNQNKDGRFKKGKPCSKLDLHGKTALEATRLIDSFIKRSYEKRLPMVLVVVGKGIHSEDGTPVIKDLVVGWLRSKGSVYISKFKEAPIKLGGSGALLIELKNKP